MKYGESLFDILYLTITLIIGITILINKKNKLSKLMGIATLILGCGDAFHLIPRVLNYFIDYNFNFYLGVGKLITSITMTIFYIFMYYLYIEKYDIKENNKITFSVWFLSLVRIILCLFPQNGWFSNESPLLWGIMRNIPFGIFGLLIVILYFKRRDYVKAFKNIWLYVLLSFIFYFIVVIGASKISILGMFMLPKTVCYILIIISFKRQSYIDIKD